MSFYLSVCRYVCLPICLNVSLSFCLSSCLCVILLLCMFVAMPVTPSLLSVCMFSGSTYVRLSTVCFSVSLWLSLSSSPSVRPSVDRRHLWHRIVFIDRPSTACKRDQRYYFDPLTPSDDASRFGLRLKLISVSLCSSQRCPTVSIADAGISCCSSWFRGLW